MHATGASLADPGAAGPSGMPHLAGAAATLRQRMSAHFVDGLDHIVEIGGHLTPVSGFLVQVPRSFTCIDPKAVPVEASSLRGEPCRVRHIDRKFQDVDLNLEPGTYGLVFVGYSLKPLGQRDPVGARLFELIGNSAVTVIEYAVALERAASQVGPILASGAVQRVAQVDYTLADGVMERSNYNERRLLVLRPARGEVA